MTSVSAVHIILTPTQPVGSGPQRGLNPGPDHQESRTLSTELPPPPPPPPPRFVGDREETNASAAKIALYVYDLLYKPSYCLCLYLFVCLSVTLSLSLSLSLSCLSVYLSLSVCLSVSLSLSHRHTQTHTSDHRQNSELICA